MRQFVVETTGHAPATLAGARAAAIGCNCDDSRNATTADRLLDLLADAIGVDREALTGDDVDPEVIEAIEDGEAATRFQTLAETDEWDSYEIPTTVNFGGEDDPDEVVGTYDPTESAQGARPHADGGRLRASTVPGTDPTAPTDAQERQGGQRGSVGWGVGVNDAGQATARGGTQEPAEEQPDELPGTIDFSRSGDWDGDDA